MTATPMPPIPPIGPTTGVATPMQASRLKPIDPLKLLRQHVTTLVVTLIAGIVLGVGTFFGLLVAVPQYTSEAQLRVSDQIKDAGELQATEDSSNKTFIQNEINRIKSPEILREALKNPDLVMNTMWYAQFDGDIQDAIETLQEEDLRVVPVRDSTLITLSMSATYDEDPDKILEAILRTYQNQLRNEATRDADDLRRVLLEERKRADDEIRLLQERERTFFTSQDGLDQLNSRMEETELKLQRLTAQQLVIELALEQAKEVLKGMEAQEGNIEPTPEDVMLVDSNGEVIEKTMRINRIKEQILAQTEGYGENHFTVRNLKVGLRAAEQDRQRVFDKKMREHLSMKYEQAIADVESLTAQYQDLLTKLEEESVQWEEHAARRAEYDQLKEQLATALENRKEKDRQLDELRLLSVRPDAVRVKRQADPTNPRLTFPRPAIIIPGVPLLSLSLVGGIIYVRELLDQRIKSPADVALLANGELLGVLPIVSEDPSAGGEVECVVERHPNGLMAESYRQVRTAILNKMDRRGYKTLMCVGAQARCGSTTFAQNLAYSLAMNGRGVLIVDANFRRPAVASAFDLRQGRGLANVLRGDCSMEDALARVEGIDIAVLQAGPAEDLVPEMLEGSRLRALLGEAESRFDLVIVDAPPALLASDSQLMAKHVDAIAVVVRADVDERGMLERMLRKLDGQRADLLGIVLNGARSAAGGYFRKSYEEFYRYSQSQQPEPGENGKAKPARRRAAAPPPASNGHATGSEAESESEAVGSGSRD